MPAIHVLDADVHYVDLGPADAAYTCVSLHGFGLDYRSNLAAYEPAFADRPHWRRLYLDLPGMGQTPAPPSMHSTDDLFAIVRAAVDALVPGTYAVTGTSYGGYLAAGLANVAPDRVRGLALVVPMVLPPDQRRLGVHEVRYRQPGVRGSAEYAADAVLITAETLRRTYTELKVPAVAADEAAIARLSANYAGTFGLPGSFVHPALIVTGRQDRVLGYADQWDRYGHWPLATYAVLDGSGHHLPIELSGLLTPLYADWLQRIERAT
jgi:pimeloyl-ACP methyl ester carboxylesterase